MTDYPDTLQSDLAHHEREQESAEDRYARELAAHPIEDYWSEAWENAFDDVSYECLLNLITQAPESAMCALADYAGIQIPNPLTEIQSEFNKRTINLYLQSWIECEQTRLQNEAIQRIFP